MFMTRVCISLFSGFVYAIGYSLCLPLSAGTTAVVNISMSEYSHKWYISDVDRAQQKVAPNIPVKTALSESAPSTADMCIQEPNAAQLASQKQHSHALTTHCHHLKSLLQHCSGLQPDSTANAVASFLAASPSHAAWSLQAMQDAYCTATSRNNIGDQPHSHTAHKAMAERSHTDVCNSYRSSAYERQTVVQLYGSTSQQCVAGDEAALRAMLHYCDKHGNVVQHYDEPTFIDLIILLQGSASAAEIADSITQYVGPTYSLIILAASGANAMLLLAVCVILLITCRSRHGQPLHAQKAEQGLCEGTHNNHHLQGEYHDDLVQHKDQRQHQQQTQGATAQYRLQPAATLAGRISGAALQAAAAASTLKAAMMHAPHKTRELGTVHEGHTLQQADKGCAGGSHNDDDTIIHEGVGQDGGSSIIEGMRSVVSGSAQWTRDKGGRLIRAGLEAAARRVTRAASGLYDRVMGGQNDGSSNPNVARHMHDGGGVDIVEDAAPGDDEVMGIGSRQALLARLQEAEPNTMVAFAMSSEDHIASANAAH